MREQTGRGFRAGKWGLQAVGFDVALGRVSCSEVKSKKHAPRMGGFNLQTDQGIRQLLESSFPNPATGLIQRTQKLPAYQPQEDAVCK